MYHSIHSFNNFTSLQQHVHHQWCHQSKYPSLQSRALPHHFTSLSGGHGLPLDFGCLSIFLVLSCSPIPQERLQELHDPQWDTLQSSTFLFFFLCLLPLSFLFFLLISGYDLSMLLYMSDLEREFIEPGKTMRLTFRILELEYFFFKNCSGAVDAWYPDLVVLLKAARLCIFFFLFTEPSSGAVSGIALLSGFLVLRGVSSMGTKSSIWTFLTGSPTCSYLYLSWAELFIRISSLCWYSRSCVVMLASHVTLACDDKLTFVI